MTEIDTLHVKADTVEITARVEIRHNSHLLDTVDVAVSSTHHLHEFNGKVVVRTADELPGVDITQLKQAIESAALAQYAGRARSFA